MRAVELIKSQLTLHQAFPDPTPGPGESLIRVSLAGICSTDLELVKGYLGFEGVLGHEFVGTVERSDDPDLVGARVVSTINFADPESPEFAEFGFRHHPNRTVLGIYKRPGVMADYVTIPTRHILRVPESVPSKAAVFTEPLAAALRIQEQIAVAPSQRIAVLGVGRLGMLIGKVLSLGGASVTMLGRREEALALPKAWGIPNGLIQEQTAEDFDLVVEATGNPEGLEQALRIIKPLGTLVLKSTYEGHAQLDLTKIVVGEITVIGSRCGPFEPALRLLMADQIDVCSLIDANYPAEKAVEAFAHAGRPGVRKVLLDFQQPSLNPA